MGKKDKHKPEVYWESKDEGLVTYSQYKQWITRSVLWQPPTDILEMEDALQVRIEVAGMKNSSFLITLEGNLLVVQGNRSVKKIPCAYHRMEIQKGDFISVVELPVAIEEEDVISEYQDGFLKINLPKKKPVSIEVKKPKQE